MPVTLSNVEREHIMRILGAAHWVIGGQKGAAVRLHMKRTTLPHKTTKLGIVRPD